MGVFSTGPLSMNYEASQFEHQHKVCTRGIRSSSIYTLSYMLKVDQVIYTMGGVFYHEESPNHTKRCKFLAETLREVFSYCQTFSRRLSTASLGEECPIIDDVDEEQEVLSSNPFEKVLHFEQSCVLG